MNWAQHIKRAESKRAFSSIAVEKATIWAQCAVGERFVKAGYDQFNQDRVLWSSKRYTKLRDLGIEFSQVVKHHKIKAAKRIFKAIQKVEIDKLNI
jgi:hypothetical protein